MDRGGIDAQSGERHAEAKRHTVGQLQGDLCAATGRSDDVLAKLLAVAADAAKADVRGRAGRQIADQE